MKLVQQYRKLFFGCLITILFLLLVALLLPAILDVNRFRPLIEERMTQQLGRRVEIQNLRLSLAGQMQFVASGVTVREGNLASDPPLLQAESLTLRFSWLSLLQGKQDPNKIVVERARISLREKNRIWNFLPAGGPVPGEARSSAQGQLSVNSLPAVEVRDSKVQVASPALAVPLLLSNYALRIAPKFLGDGYSLESSFVLGESTPANISFSADLGNLPTKLEWPSSFQSKARMSKVPFSWLRSAALLLKQPALLEDLEGLLDLNVQTSADRPGELVTSGKIVLSDLARKPASINSPNISISSTFEAGFKTQTSTLDLTQLVVDAGTTRIQASGKIENLQTQPRGEVRFAAKQASPLDLIRLATLARGGAEPQKTSGTLDFDLTLSGAFDNPLISGSFDSQELSFFYADLKQPVRVSQIHADLRGKQLKTNQFQATVGNQTSVLLSAQIDDLAGDPLITFQVRTTQAAPILELLRIGSSLGVRLPAEMTVESGSAAFDISSRNFRPKSRRFDAQGSVTLVNAKARIAPLKQPFTIPSLELSLGSGQIRSNRFQVQMGDSGALAIDFNLRDTPAGPDIQSTIKTLQPLAADQWLAAGKAFGVPLPAGLQLSGGWTTLDLQVRLLPGKTPEASGALRFQEGTITSNLSREPLFIRNAQFEMQPEQLLLRDLEARFVNTTWRGEGSAKIGSDLKLNFSLRGDTLDLQKLLASMPAQGSIVTKETSKAGTAASADRPLIAEGKVALHQVKNDTLELSNLSTLVRYENQLLNLPNLVFNLYSGMHQGSLRLDLRGNIPQHQYEGRLSNVDVHALLMQNTTLGPVLQGRLNSTCVLIGEGIDYNSIIQKIKGNGIYELREGRLNTFSLGARLSLLTQLTGWNLGSKTTELQEADGSFQIDGPRIILDKSRVRTPEALVITDGSVGLDKTLNLKATAELSEQWKVSGNIVGQAIAGIAATFFRNEEGKVIVPFYLRGTIDNPIFALDSKTVQAGVGQVLKPENIQSGIKSVGDFIQQASKMKSASPETTLPAAPTPPLAPGATTTTTLPSKTGTLIEGIGNLVGGILGAVQQGAKPPTQPPPDIPPEIVLVPNVTHLISEIQVLTAMPALSEEVKQARLRAVINTIFAVPSPR